MYSLHSVLKALICFTFFGINLLLFLILPSLLLDFIHPVTSHHPVSLPFVYEALSHSDVFLFIFGCLIIVLSIEFYVL